VLRRLGGGLFALNPDLVERVEATPDTVVTLVDDKKFLVEENLEEILQLIVDYRAYIITRSTELAVVDERGRPTLHVVPNEHVTSQENSLSPGVDLDFSHTGKPQNDSIEAWLDEVDAEYGDTPDRSRSVVSGVDFSTGNESGGADPDGSTDTRLGGGN
jgi:flagellar protein FlbD